MSRRPPDRGVLWRLNNKDEPRVKLSLRAPETSLHCNIKSEVEI